jgi:hypothetical protein
MTVYEPRFSSDSQEQDPLVQINHVASKALYSGR